MGFETICDNTFEYFIHVKIFTANHFADFHRNPLVHSVQVQAKPVFEHHLAIHAPLDSKSRVVVLDSLFLIRISIVQKNISNEIFSEISCE